MPATAAAPWCTVKVLAVMVAGSIAPLKVAEIFTLSATSAPLLDGLVELTVGAEAVPAPGPGAAPGAAEALPQAVGSKERTRALHRPVLRRENIGRRRSDETQLWAGAVRGERKAHSSDVKCNRDIYT